MDSKGRPSVLSQILGDVVCNTLCPNEDKDLGILCTDMIEVLDELAALLEISANFDNLCDVVVSRQLHGPNVYLDHIIEEVLIGKCMSETAYLLK